MWRSLRRASARTRSPLKIKLMPQLSREVSMLMAATKATALRPLRGNRARASMSLAAGGELDEHVGVRKPALSPVRETQSKTRQDAFTAIVAWYWTNIADRCHRHRFLAVAINPATPRPTFPQSLALRPVKSRTSVGICLSRQMDAPLR